MSQSSVNGESPTSIQKPGLSREALITFRNIFIGTLSGIGLGLLLNNIEDTNSVLGNVGRVALGYVLGQVGGFLLSRKQLQEK